MKFSLLEIAFGYYCQWSPLTQRKRDKLDLVKERRKMEREGGGSEMSEIEEGLTMLREREREEEEVIMINLRDTEAACLTLLTAFQQHASRDQ